MPLVLLAFVLGTLLCLQSSSLPPPWLACGGAALCLGVAAAIGARRSRRRAFPGPPDAPGRPGLLTDATCATAATEPARARLLRWQRLRRGRGLQFLLVFLGAMCLGVAGAAWQARAVLAARLPEALTGRSLSLPVRIVDLPQRLDEGRRLRVQVQPSAEHAELLGRGLRVWCTDTLLTPENPPRAGELWELTLRLRPPRGLANEGLFDYEAWLTTQRIAATGYCRGPAIRLARAPAHGPLAWRARIAAAIDGLAGPERAKALLKALAVGDARSLDPAAREVLAATGTAHLVAVSGLHVGLVGLGAAALLRFLLLRLPGGIRALGLRRALAELAGLGLAAVYVLLAGAGIPARRALLMLAIAAGARAVGSPLGAAHLLLLTLFAVLLVDPLAGMAAGTWLSFTAVAVLMFTQGRAACPWPAPWSWLGPQAAVAIGLAPLLADLGEAQPRFGLLANLLAIPWVAMVCTPLALAGALLELLGKGFGAVLWQPGLLALEPLLPGLGLLAAGDAGGWRPLLVDVPARIGFAVACVLLLLPRGLPVKLPAVCLLLALSLPRDPRPLAPGAFEIEVFDVGQGTAVAVRTRRHLLVYDTGARFSDSFDSGRAVIAARLLRDGRRWIDRLVVSHGDADHIGGAEGLLAALPVRGLDSSVPERFAGSRPLAAACRAGTLWTWDDVRFRVLHPPDASRRWQGNNGSCVLHVSGTGGSALLTGDIEESAEAWLRRHLREALPADVVLLPHHGSRTSSSPGWARATRARWVISTTGHGNRYRHPYPKVIERWLRLGAVHLDTARDGALRIRMEESGVSVRAERRDTPRWWRSR